MAPRLALLLLAGLAACAPATPRAPAPPPPFSTAGTGDAARQAVLHVAWAFGDTRRLAGRPAEAAQAAAELEWLADALGEDQRWAFAPGIMWGVLEEARRTLRASLGISSAAPSAEVVPALATAAEALRGGARAAAARALDPVAGGQGAAVLARLDAMPPQPQAAYGARLAQDEMSQLTHRDAE
jgi:hypothetical protein